MARPGLGDFAGIWKTVSEVDVNAVRREATRPLVIACVGHPVALFEIDRLLRRAPTRYALGPTPIVPIPLEQAPARLADIGKAALLIVALDARLRPTAQEQAALAQLAGTMRPALGLLLFAPPLPEVAGAAAPALEENAVRMPDPLAPEAGERLAEAVLDRLPADLHLAAARRLPGLRAPLAHRLTRSVCLTNATVALASGLPSQVPILGLPITAADAVMLTKNQVLLVFRLALAFGAPPEFQKQMLEILPVIGAGLAWRELARTLAGFVPLWGIVPKVTIAYAGTYVAGVAAARWYETGLVSRAEMRRISGEAQTVARDAAAQLVDEAKAAGDLAGRGSQAVARGARTASAKAAETLGAAMLTANVGARRAASATQKAGARAIGGVRRVRVRRFGAARPSTDEGSPPPAHPSPDAPDTPPPDVPGMPPDDDGRAAQQP